MLNLFLKNILDAKIDYPKNTILVYHSDYTPPKYRDVTYFKFEDYYKVYANLEPSCIILVGLNKIVNPSNRCDFINEYLSTLTQNLYKISIDNSPFIGEPWRLFFHYLYTHSGKFNVPHSYAIETEWKHWFYRETTSCRLSGDNIKLFITDTYSDLDLIDFKYEFYDADEKQIKYYDEIKNFVFNKYNSPKLFINNILKMSNDYFKVKISFDSYRDIKKDFFHKEIISVPNIGIYQFVIEENIRRTNIYNAVIK